MTAKVICGERGFGHLPLGLLNKLKEAAEQGYAKAELLWLCNDKSASVFGMLGRSPKVLRLRREIAVREKRDSWVDPFLWG